MNDLLDMLREYRWLEFAEDLAKAAAIGGICYCVFVMLMAYHTHLNPPV